MLAQADASPRRRARFCSPPRAITTCARRMRRAADRAARGRWMGPTDRGRTLRELAEEQNIPLGTVKHAHSALALRRGCASRSSASPRRGHRHCREDGGIMTTQAPSHHVSEEQHLEYVAGACTRAAALAVACHLSLCLPLRGAWARPRGAGRRRARGLSGADPRGWCLDRMLARPGREEGRTDRGAPSPPGPDVERLLATWGVPRAIAPYLPSGADATRWRRLVPASPASTCASVRRRRWHAS